MREETRKEKGRTSPIVSIGADRVRIFVVASGDEETHPGEVRDDQRFKTKIKIRNVASYAGELDAGQRSTPSLSATNR